MSTHSALFHDAIERDELNPRRAFSGIRHKEVAFRAAKVAFRADPTIHNLARLKKAGTAVANAEQALRDRVNGTWFPPEFTL